MRTPRGHDRRPARRGAPGAAPGPGRRRPAGLTVTGADVLLVGYFSAKEKDFAARMDAAAAELTALGARVVGRIVQRRGVSAGGARKMTLPYSSRTLLSAGKAREAARAREAAGAGAVVFVAALTDRQRQVLTELFGCPVGALAELSRTSTSG
ncbi:hypothetical protein [Streptomyces sp. NPDC013740]|uniref:hypothetical protein n=1 Tax=Streptomyces sp. NPDC013740 TaxID=3364867 RepID=UPI0037017FE3